MKTKSDWKTATWMGKTQRIRGAKAEVRKLEAEINRQQGELAAQRARITELQDYIKSLHTKQQEHLEQQRAATARVEHGAEIVRQIATEREEWKARFDKLLSFAAGHGR